MGREAILKKTSLNWSRQRETRPRLDKRHYYYFASKRQTRGPYEMPWKFRKREKENVSKRAESNEAVLTRTELSWPARQHEALMSVSYSQYIAETQRAFKERSTRGKKRALEPHTTVTFRAHGLMQLKSSSPGQSHAKRLRCACAFRAALQRRKQRNSN